MLHVCEVVHRYTDTTDIRSRDLRGCRICLPSMCITMETTKCVIFTVYEFVINCTVLWHTAPD